MAGSGGASTTAGAGPYVPAGPDPLLPVSPVELVQALLQRDTVKSICPWVITGPAEHVMQQQGVCSLTDAGATQTNPHMPIIWKRIQVRCIGHTVAHSEQIGQHIYSLLHTRHRELVQQPSSDQWYLVHRTRCVSEPSGHYDGVSTWESLAFYEAMVGTAPTAGAAGGPIR